MPRIIHVCGPWGAGKSTLLRNLTARADAVSDQRIGRELSIAGQRVAALYHGTGDRAGRAMVEYWQAGLHVVGEYSRKHLTPDMIVSLQKETQSVTLFMLTTTAEDCVAGLHTRADRTKRFPTIDRLKARDRDPLQLVKGYIASLDAFAKFAAAEHGMHVVRSTRAEAVDKLIEQIVQ